MSVVVRMEMPKGCWDCPCVNGDYGYCQADKEERQIEDPNERPSWCPIICSIPEWHGRLVDGDKLKHASTDGRKWCDPCPVWGEIYRAETIVPAEAERVEA